MAHNAVRLLPVGASPERLAHREQLLVNGGRFDTRVRWRGAGELIVRRSRVRTTVIHAVAKLCCGLEGGLLAALLIIQLLVALVSALLILVLSIRIWPIRARVSPLHRASATHTSLPHIFVEVIAVSVRKLLVVGLVSDHSLDEACSAGQQTARLGAVSLDISLGVLASRLVVRGGLLSNCFTIRLQVAFLTVMAVIQLSVAI